MVEKFLHKDCQVITVSWKSHGGQTGYLQATANARLVGAEVAFLLTNIKVRSVKILNYFEIQLKSTENDVILGDSRK